jgi:hypothetical protein
MTGGTRRLLKRLAVVVAAGGLVFGAVIGVRAVAGGDVGEACSMDFGCKPGMRCGLRQGLDKVCTRPCEADVECPDGWRCGDAVLLDRSDVFASVRQRVCLPGAPGSGLLP